jgi:hypothetical protein
MSPPDPATLAGEPFACMAPRDGRGGTLEQRAERHKSGRAGEMPPLETGMAVPERQRTNELNRGDPESGPRCEALSLTRGFFVARKSG